MKLKTTLLGKTYTFRDIKEVLAKANEEKTGDRLAGLAAETAQERIAAKVVLSQGMISHNIITDIWAMTFSVPSVREYWGLHVTQV